MMKFNKSTTLMNVTPNTALPLLSRRGVLRRPYFVWVNNPHRQRAFLQLLLANFGWGPLSLAGGQVGDFTSALLKAVPALTPAVVIGTAAAFVGAVFYALHTRNVEEEYSPFRRPSKFLFLLLGQDGPVAEIIRKYYVNPTPLEQFFM